VYIFAYNYKTDGCPSHRGGGGVGCLRNKSWKPECVGSFNMDWRRLVFYSEPEARDKIY
jgi:hypothetical protein